MPNRHASSRRWSGGSTTAWRKVRAFVLERDGNRCQLRLDGCTTVATQAHHLSPRELVGDNPDYILAACQSCNSSAGAPEKSDPEPRGLSW